MKVEEFLDKRAYWLLKFYNLLEELASAEIIGNDVKDFELTDEQKANAMQKLINSISAKTESEVNNWLTKNKMTSEGYLEKVRVNTKLEQIAVQQFKHQAKKKFLERKQELDIADYSLIRVENPYLARELMIEILVDEESFERLAEKFSQGPESKTKGHVGEVAINKAHPTIVDQLRSCNPGEVKGIIRIDEWNIILRLNKRRSAEYNDQIEKKMCRELYENEKAERVKELMKRWDRLYGTREQSQTQS